jgi:hypothetical protein
MSENAVRYGIPSTGTIKEKLEFAGQLRREGDPIAARVIEELIASLQEAEQWKRDAEKSAKNMESTLRSQEEEIRWLRRAVDKLLSNPERTSTG